MSAPTYPVSEDSLRERLGCSRESIRELRKNAAFPRGEAWQVVGKAVFWSAYGAAKALETLGGVGMADAQKNAPSVAAFAEAEASVEMVEVVRANFPNERVVLARRKDGEQVYVRVPASRNFVPRLRDGTAMTFRARLDRGQWVLVGRSPRWPGRW